MGKSVKSISQGGGITGINVFGKAKDLLFGEKQAGEAGGYTQLTPEQQALMDKYSALAKQDTTQIATNMANQQEAQLRQNVADQQMRASQMVAQRGLGNSSVGLNAVLGQSGQLANQIGAVRANQPLAARQLGMENLETARTGINALLGTRDYKQGVAGGRKGGLAPLVGAGIGAMYGGPAGAQAGMGVGQAAQGMFS